MAVDLISSAVEGSVICPNRNWNQPELTTATSEFRGWWKTHSKIGITVELNGCAACEKNFSLNLFASLRTTEGYHRLIIWTIIRSPIPFVTGVLLFFLSEYKLTRSWRRSEELPVAISTKVVTKNKKKKKRASSGILSIHCLTVSTASLGTNSIGSSIELWIRCSQSCWMRTSIGRCRIRNVFSVVKYCFKVFSQCLQLNIIVIGIFLRTHWKQLLHRGFIDLIR